MRSKRKFKKTPHKQKKQKVEKLGNLKAEIISVTVDNPDFTHDHPISNGNPKQGYAILNMRENIALAWHKNKKIGDPELKAALQFRSIYERSLGCSMGSLDYSVTKVDGGRFSDGFSDSRQEAMKEITRIQKQFTITDYSLLERVIGRSEYLNGICKNRRQEDAMSLHCRSLLTKLAREFGYG